MGMDIYGSKPVPLKGEETRAKAAEEALIKLRNKIGPVDKDGYKMSEWWKKYDELNDDVKKAYGELENYVDKYHPGKYFRANIWSWRPIHMLCETIIQDKKLPLDTYGWGENSGYGLYTQEDCDMLATELEEFLLSLDEVYLDIDISKYPEFNKDNLRFYINMNAISGDYKSPFGICYEDGGFIRKEDWTEELAEKYKKFIGNKVISHSFRKSEFKVHGKSINSAYSFQPDHLKEFTVFLRHCGGFNIH